MSDCRTLCVTLKVKEGAPPGGPEWSIMAHLAVALAIPVALYAVIFTGWFKNLINASGTFH